MSSPPGDAYKGPYTQTKIVSRLVLSFTQTALDYIYAILASFQIEEIRSVLIVFLAFYPTINIIAWSGILGYLDLKYNNGVYGSFKDLFKYNWKRNLKLAVVFGFFQIFNLLPFYIYIMVYKEHHAIFTEQLMNLLEQDKQNKRMLLDEEKSIGTIKTMKTIDLNQIHMPHANIANAAQQLNNLPNSSHGIFSKQHSSSKQPVGPNFPRNAGASKSMVKIVQNANKSMTPPVQPHLRSQTYFQPMDSPAQDVTREGQQTSGRTQFQQQILTPANQTIYLPTEQDAQSVSVTHRRGVNRQTTALQNNNTQPNYNNHSFGYNLNFKQNLKTQIAIEANCKFSLGKVMEEVNFQTLFEAGEIMEMAFKSFPMFAIQLCNNMLQNNWALYWFTILYFCILLIRLFVIGIIFIKFLLLNDRMIKFLENIRYFHEEMIGDEIYVNNSYPMPEVLEINQLITLKRIVDISETSSLSVRNLIISIPSEPKHGEAIIKGINSSISKFQGLNKVVLNLYGNDMNEEELNMIKTKFDNNPSYEKFYFQSEHMVIIYDNQNSDFMFRIQHLYKHLYFESEEYVNGQMNNPNFFEFGGGFNRGSSRSILFNEKDGDTFSMHNKPMNINPQINLTEIRIKQLFIIVPNHFANADEQRIIFQILTDIPIGYVEIEINFEDSTILTKIQELIPNLKFTTGYIISKNFSFYKNGKFTKLQHSKLISFELSLPIENNRDEVKPLSILGSKGLNKMLRNHSRLFDYSIVIPDNLITNHGMILISDALPNHCQHLKLDLQNNMLGDMGSITLAGKLSKMTRLNTLFLSLRDNKFLTATSIDLISDSLTKMPKLRQLIIDLQQMELSNRSANKFFNRLQALQNIEVLTIILKQNKIDPMVQLVVDMNRKFGTSEKQQVNEKGSFNLAKALEQLDRMKFLTLDISSNNIDQAGAVFIHKSLGSLVNLTSIVYNISENYIKRPGIMQLAMSLKKLTTIQMIDLVLDSVKKPSTNAQRIRKHGKGEQRMSLDILIKAEQKPLQSIFKKVAKFNKSLKELKKYIYETMSKPEESTLQRFVALNLNKDGVVEEADKITKDIIMKFLAVAMESNMRAYQITNRKLSSFEDLFNKMNSLRSLHTLKLSLKLNGLVNLDFKMAGECVEQLVGLKNLSLNLSSNVISDIGVKFFFESLAKNISVSDIEIDLSSNLIKYEGAEHIAKALITMSDRMKKPAYANLNQKDTKNMSQQEGEEDEEKDKMPEQQTQKKKRKQVQPRDMQRFSLNIRNNKIEYQGGFQLVEMACKLRDEKVDISLLMGNCGIVNQKKDEDDNRYGFFHILKKELNQNFEFE